MTPVTIIKTTESYEISFVSINWQTSYYSGSLRQDYGIIRGLPTGSPSGQYIYQNGPKRAGLFTALNQTVQAVHRCTAMGHHLGSTFIETDGLNYRIRLCRPCVAAVAGCGI